MTSKGPQRESLQRSEKADSFPKRMRVESLLVADRSDVQTSAEQEWWLLARTNDEERP